MVPSHESSKTMIPWLETTTEPRISRLISNISDIRSAWLATAGRRWIDLDGKQMGDVPSAYAHLTKAFGLPDYFGQNLNALHECLSDLDGLQGSAFVVYLAHASEALVSANSDALAGLLDTLTLVADELADPVDEGQPWDRPAIPFHVLLADAGHDDRLQSYPPTPDMSPCMTPLAASFPEGKPDSKNEVDLRRQVLLSFQVALLGMVTSALRGVAISWDESQIDGVFLYEGDVTETELEIVSDVEAEVISHFVNHRINLQPKSYPPPRKLSDEKWDVWVYQRME